MDRFDKIVAALGRVPVHSHDPDTSRQAADAIAGLIANDERDALSAIADHACTALELELVFPRWRPLHAAKRLSDLRRVGLADTDDTRRVFPGHRVASSVYHPTTMGRAVATPWPNTPVKVLIENGLARLEAGLPSDRGEWPCPFCPVVRPNRTGAILHLQRRHDMPRLDPATLRPFDDLAAA